jgi:hypothetical protein
MKERRTLEREGWREEDDRKKEVIVRERCEREGVDSEREGRE